MKKKAAELKECQRSLWGKQMVLLCNGIHQNPGDVKSARGYTRNEMPRTEAHGVRSIRLNATVPLCGKKIRYLKKKTAHVCICVRNGASGFLFPPFVFQEDATSGCFLVKTLHHGMNPKAVTSDGCISVNSARFRPLKLNLRRAIIKGDVFQDVFQ